MTKICIIAGNEHEAYQWARSQNIPDECWFYPKSMNDLLFKNNFYPIVIGTAGMNMPPSLFEKVYQLARERGKIGRK